MRASTWTPTVGARVWVLPHRFAGQILSMRKNRTSGRYEYCVRYTAEDKGFAGEKLEQEGVGWFPGGKLDRRII